MVRSAERRNVPMLQRRRSGAWHTTKGVRGAAFLLTAAASVALAPLAFLVPQGWTRRLRALTPQRESRTLALGAASSSTELPQPLLTAPLQRLEFDSEDFVGAGYDLIDIRVLTAQKEPIIATFMLDSGLSTNLLTDTFLKLLELPAEAQRVEGSALGGAATSGLSTVLPGVELLGEAPVDQSRYIGVWEGGSWRARCSIDWDAWVAEATANGGKLSNGEVEYTVLPTTEMTEAQVEGLVGRSGIEIVEGALGSDGFVGKGVSVTPKGFLAVVERYEFKEDGDELLEEVSGMRLRREPAYPSLKLPGSVPALCVPFAQEELAARQKVAIGGMLGQVPLHQMAALDIDPVAGILSAYRARDAATVAAAAGLLRLPGVDLNSGLFGVRVAHDPLLRSGGQDRGIRQTVPALVDSGSAYSILNWPAAELLLGLKNDDEMVKEAPRIRGMGVGGGMVEFVLLTLSIGLVSDEGDGSESLVSPAPVRVAIGDANIFEDLVGREEQGSWPFGLGPKPQKPAGLIGQDLLSQQRYILAASEPAMYISRSRASSRGSLEFVGLGDCLDSSGRRLRGLQRKATTPDEAALACLQLPPGSCKGVAVTPLTTKRFQGLCYIFVDSERLGTQLEEKGWRRYTSPDGQELAEPGAEIATANGDVGAECYSWKAE